MPPHQPPKTGPRRGPGELGQYVGHNAAPGEDAHEPQGDRYGGIQVAPTAPARRAENQPGEDGPAETADGCERGVEVLHVQSGGRATQPPDDRHRQEQHDGGERELVGGTQQAQPT